MLLLVGNVKRIIDRLSRYEKVGAMRKKNGMAYKAPEHHRLKRCATQETLQIRKDGKQDEKEDIIFQRNA